MTVERPKKFFEPLDAIVAHHLEITSMNLSRAALFGWAVLFIVFECVLLFAWILLGMKFSSGVPMPWAIVSFLAIWPYMLLSLFVRDQFFDKFPFLFFVADFMGWAVIGALTGFFVKRRS